MPTQKNEKKLLVKKDKTQRLLELKQLLDNGILTIEEFEAEKKKILEEEDGF